MDSTDHLLVQLLQADGRATQLQLAKEVGLSQPATAERIRKLEEAGSSPATPRRSTRRSSGAT